MTQPVRRVHFWVWIILAVLVPVVFIASLIVRRTTTPKNPNVHWEQYK
jgi:hypothetical protein